MSFTAETYKDILDDIKTKSTGLGSAAMRMVRFENGSQAAFSVNVNTGMRAIYFSISTPDVKNKYPHWQGVSIDIVKLTDYGTNQNFFALTQLPQSEGYIFEIVAEDLRSAVEKAKSSSEALGIITIVLTKWKSFFLSEKDLILSPERQQGLYGELLFLEELLKENNAIAVTQWAGSNDETHDFYLAANAVEVKTTSSQAPYFAHISSEYQLDNKDIPGHLFLRFYALRKSQSSGDTLPELVTRIRTTIADMPDALHQFREKLLKYGYLDEAAEQYPTGYFVRDEYTFEVKEGFPRVIKTDLKPGVVDILYAVNIAQCMLYTVDKVLLWTFLKGGNTDA